MALDNPLLQEQPSSVPTIRPSKINWKQVTAFIVLTFGLTWTLDLFLYLNGGLYSPTALLALQFQMLLPAFSAMILGLFFFKDSPIHIRSNKTTSRWFIWYFIIFTLLYAVATIIGFLRPYDISDMSSWLLYPSILGLILVIVLRLIGGKESFSSVGLAGGKPKYWVLFGVGILLYLGLQTLLCWLFKMGQPLDLELFSTQAAMSGMSLPVMMILLASQTVLLGPFLGLLITFGEEYGWRGYLQPALTKKNRIWGVLGVGVIWGVWHWPVIWMGHNYPGHPVLGSLLMVLFCIGLAFLLGYAVIKAKGVWIAAFLHALVNQTSGLLIGMLYVPRDTTWSFGIGFPSLLVMIPLILLILRDPVWKESN
jgi:uncharacterized protein